MPALSLQCMRESVFLGLGANLGNRLVQLQAAVAALRRHPAIELVACSPVYESAAHTLADEPQPDYLNAVVWVRTLLEPEALLALCLQLEAAAGRQRTAPWSPRPLDLDILAYGQRTLCQATLTIPHPRLSERRFVLQPWADLAPEFYVPAPFCTSVAMLLARCPDRAPLHRLGVLLES
ncbi:2-amino-4-hydroxy-6-hydroxymethyldihydropteridine pyrophosphokinase [bacterium HR18]|nr:2-amino-4-hydroxy-6-hydroxymethyldihydropteridine pyrophosphokinase [bacterium HR18]